MIAPQVTVTQTLDRTALMRQAQKMLASHQVLVGIPEDQDARKDGEPIGNAAIGYVHEHGSPAQNIPARAFLLPGISDILAQAKERLAEGARAAMRGNLAGVMSNLNAIGILGQNAVRARFTNNDWAPLAQSTLDARIRRQAPEKRKKDRPSKAARANPLIDSGSLRRAISYVVRKR